MIEDKGRGQLSPIGDLVSEDERPDQPALEPGAERVDEFTVGGPLLTDVGGTIGARVLSTPAMIAMMERSSSALAYQRVPQGKATVGFEVCVSERTIGVGTHERRVIDVGQLA